MDISTVDEMVALLSREDILLRQKKNLLTWWLNDIFKLLRNIDQTSLDKLDRAKRLIELEAEKGIPKTHLILDVS